MDPTFISFLAVLLLSGMFSSLGLGGASAYVPIFFWMGIPIEAAIAAGLFINVVSTSISSFVYNTNRLIDLKSAFWIIAGALLGAPLGVWLSANLPHRAIIGIFSAVLLLSAFRLFWGRQKPQRKKPRATAGAKAGFLEELGASAATIALARGVAGGATGLVSGTLGIGGGIFLMPFLMDSGFTPKKAAALSTFVVFFSSVFSLIGHMATKELDFAFIAITGIAAVVGSYFGSKKMAEGKMSDEMVKGAFAFLLLAFGLKLAYDFFTL